MFKWRSALRLAVHVTKWLYNPVQSTLDLPKLCSERAYLKKLLNFVSNHECPMCYEVVGIAKGDCTITLEYVRWAFKGMCRWALGWCWWHKFEKQVLHPYKRIGNAKSIWCKQNPSSQALRLIIDRCITDRNKLKDFCPFSNNFLQCSSSLTNGWMQQKLFT